MEVCGHYTSGSCLSHCHCHCPPPPLAKQKLLCATCVWVMGILDRFGGLLFADPGYLSFSRAIGGLWQRAGKAGMYLRWLNLFEGYLLWL